MKFSFSEIDPNNIVSYSLEGIRLIKPNLIQTIKYIQIFHLSTDKHKKIIIHLHKNSNLTEIHDGPGTLSNILQIWASKIKTHVHNYCLVYQTKGVLVAQYIGYFKGMFLFHKDIGNLDLQLLIT